VTPPEEPTRETPAADGDGTVALLSETQISFREQISAEAVRSRIEEAAASLEMAKPTIQLSTTGWDGKSSRPFKVWTVKMSTDAEQTEVILGKIRDELARAPVWPGSSQIGGAVAGKMQNVALAALMMSLLGIVGYIWFRFQKVAYGLAAVVALVHDVTITIGAIAVSAWLANYFGFLLIDNFKISLAEVAALLTIVGYSLNDTIVVFDRIREVKGKSPDLTAKMVNASINQTLSRTLLTSTTTLIVVLILYTLGGQGIHTFAFCLLIGVIVGTYSSVFVASPFLLWMSGTPEPEGKQAAA
jgi:SecD/SecF fusion protein